MDEYQDINATQHTLLKLLVGEGIAITAIGDPNQAIYGFRGSKLDVNFLKKTLVKISEIPQKHKNIEELDINPFMLKEKSGRVVDARIVFS